MAQLAQGYIHLRPYRVETELQALGKSIDEISFEIARRIYGQGIEVDVRLEEGTLRGWITVIGTIALTTYTVIAEYKGFTESVPLLCDKARSFGFEVCEQFIERNDAKSQQVFRVERKLKTPGRINRLLKRVKKLDELAPKLKVRPNTSSRITEFSEHEADGSEFQESDGSAVEIFPVLGEPAAAIEPRNRTLSGKELARCRTLRLGPSPVPPHKNRS